jgi:hypothetical protein
MRLTIDALGFWANDARGATSYGVELEGSKMRFPEAVRMADGDSGHSPVWARSKRRKRGGGAGAGAFFGFIVFLLAVFGAVTIGLSIKERSVAGGGATIDGWIAVGKASVLEAVGKAPKTAGVAADKAGDTAAKTGDALKAGAAETAETLKKQ